MPVLDYNYAPMNIDKPRLKLLSPGQNLKIKWRPVWIFKKSIFKKCCTENDDLILKCFQEDWKFCRIDKLIKDQEDLAKVKNIIQQNYRFFKNLYKYLASQMPFGDIWCVQWPIFEDFIRKCNIFNDDFQDNKLIIKFTAAFTDNQVKGNHRAPQRSLIRYQLIEVFIRIINERFIQTLEYENYAEALQDLLDFHIFPVIDKNQIDLERWRQIYYWNEENDLVLTVYKPIVQEVYKKYANIKRVVGIFTMSLQEFILLFRDLDLINDNLPHNAIIECFNYGMSLQIDELSSDKIYQMTYLEFIEAFSRAAQKQPIEGKNRIFKQNQRLHISLENLILFIKNSKILDVEFLENYVEIKTPVFLDDQKINSAFY